MVIQKKTFTCPSSFASHWTVGKVYKLKTPLSLKQSPITCFGSFHSAMMKFEYKQRNADKRIGIKIMVLIVYVGDTVVTGNDEFEIVTLKD